jgi:signal transduction histidine kinase
MTIDPDLLPYAVFRVDGERRITDANRAAHELVAAADGELIGAPFDERVDARGPDGLPLWTVVATGGDGGGVRPLPEQHATVRRADGTKITVHAAGMAELGEDGRVRGEVVVLRPDDGGGAGPSGIEIVSTVSHELRSPLTSVKGYTSLLLNRWDRLKDEQKQMMLQQVHHDADRVTRLVTELLDISRLETGRLVLRRQMVDLRELAEMVVEKVTLEYPEVECAFDLPDDLPEVYADPDKVEQVLTNLVENAAKYADPKGMRIAGEVAGDCVTVAVTDRGDGIPEADLPRVFQKFFRRDHGKPTGTGLGLWISRGLVEAHGGTLTVSSRVGEGSTFAFTLPVRSIEEVLGP